MSSTSLCNLCARHCNVKRPEQFGSPDGTLGFCRMPANPVVARAGLHFWEEPCISGQAGSGTVFFSGCNLRCVFCQNHEISTGCRGKEISVDHLTQIYHQLIGQGANNINLVTPSHYVHAVAESLSKPLPVPVVYNTNAYEDISALKLLQGKIQIYLPDLKYALEEPAKRFSRAPDYFRIATEAIMEMYRQTGPYQMDKSGELLKSGVIIRHLVLPGHVQNSLRVIDWVADHFQPGEVLFSLMRQYVPCAEAFNYPELSRKVSDEEYQLVEDHLFESGIEDGFVQDAESSSKDFIPAFDGTGV